MEDTSEASGSHKGVSKTGLSLLTLTGGMALALTVGCAPFISPALRRICLPYIPATDSQVKNIMSMLSNRSGNVLDIGSGDGRVVIAAARNGFFADGVELNPWLILYSKWEALRCGVHNRTNFYRHDLWKFDMSCYNNVVIFGVEEMMPEIEEKLCRELPANAAVIACRFPLPSKTPLYTYGHGVDTVWFYLNISNRGKER